MPPTISSPPAGQVFSRRCFTRKPVGHPVNCSGGLYSDTMSGTMSYVFDPRVLHAAAIKRVGLPHQEMVRLLSDDLAQLYPGHICQKQDWILSIAGGSMGIMTVLHGSLWEYVIIFGTPIGTQGFAGRY